MQSMVSEETEIRYLYPFPERFTYQGSIGIKLFHKIFIEETSTS